MNLLSLYRMTSDAHHTTFNVLKEVAEMNDPNMAAIERHLVRARQDLNEARQALLRKHRESAEQAQGD